jgi:hypothetical protein
MVRRQLFIMGVRHLLTVAAGVAVSTNEEPKFWPGEVDQGATGWARLAMRVVLDPSRDKSGKVDAA